MAAPDTDFAIRLDIGATEGQIVADRAAAVERRAARFRPAGATGRVRPAEPESTHLLRGTWRAPWLRPEQRAALRAHLEAAVGATASCTVDCPLCTLEAPYAGLEPKGLAPVGVNALSSGMIGHLAAGTPDLGYPEKRVRLAPPESAARARDRLSAALTLLEAHLPWWADLRDEACARIVLVESENLLGFSSALVPDTVFLNAECGVAQFVERLVHEATHCQVYRIQDSLKLTDAPPGHLIASPLRRDPRPVLGVLHATVVSARVHLAAAAMADAGEHRDEFTRMARTAAADVAFGAGELCDRGILTEHGRVLVLAASAATTWWGEPHEPTR